MKHGNLVAIDENKYIRLIIPTEEPEEPEEEIENSTGIEDSIDGEQNGSADRHVWQYDETLALINSMANHLDDLNHLRKRKFVFQNVANDMLSNGFSVTSLACQSKWKNLLRSYKSCKDHKNKTGRGPSRFLFFDAIDNLVGEKPSNKCTHTLESSNLLNITPSTSAVDDMPETPIASSNVSLEENNNVTTKRRTKKDNTHQSDFISLKNEESMAIQTAKLKLEETKVKLLQELVDQD